MGKLEEAIRKARREHGLADLGSSQDSGAATRKQRNTLPDYASRNVPKEAGAGLRNGAPRLVKSPADRPAISTRIKVDMQVLRDAGLLAGSDETHSLAQQFRRIKRPLLRNAFEEQALREKNSNVLMIASALPGTGKTFCSINLAECIALERDVGAVLVDADVLKPNITRVLGLEKRPGLIDYLIDPSVELGDVLVQTDVGDIVVMPAGKKHPEATELLASRRMRDLVGELSLMFSDHVVVFDTPPLLITSEAQVLAEHMGQIVLVLAAGESSRESAQLAVELLDRGKPINAILNKSRKSAHGSYYGRYDAYYSSYSGGDKNDGDA